MESSQICRCCLGKECDDLILLHEFYEGNNKLRLSDCFEMITGITVDEIESYEKLCFKCKIELVNAYQFRERAVSSNQRLKEVKFECDDFLDETEIKFESLPQKNVVENLSDIVRKKRQRRKKEQKNVVKKLEKLSYHCHHCSQTTRDKRDLRMHLFRRHFKHMKTYLCNNCGRKFASEYELKEHVRAIHNNERTYKCPQCSKSYPYLQSLKAHLTSHSDIRKFICEICSAAFKTGGALFNHRQRHWEPAEEYKCEVCEINFSHKIQLKKHMDQVHSNQQKIACPDCGKLFKLKNSMELHKKIHTGDMSKCQMCPKEYSCPKKLQIHIQFAHDGHEKQFKCHLCTSEFHQNHRLNRHLRTVHKEQVVVDKRRIKRIESNAINNKKSK